MGALHGDNEENTMGVVDPSSVTRGLQWGKE